MNHTKQHNKMTTELETSCIIIYIFLESVTFKIDTIKINFMILKIQVEKNVYDFAYLKTLSILVHILFIIYYKSITHFQYYTYRVLIVNFLWLARY